MRIIRTSSNYLLRILNDVLSYSKMDVGKVELEMKPVHLASVFKEVCAAISAVMWACIIHYIVCP